MALPLMVYKEVELAFEEEYRNSLVIKISIALSNSIEVCGGKKAIQLLARIQPSRQPFLFGNKFPRHIILDKNDKIISYAAGGSKEIYQTLERIIKKVF